MHATLLYDEHNTLVTHVPRQKDRHWSASPTSLVDFSFFAKLVQEPRWRARVEARFKEIRRLRYGWDGYAAAPIGLSGIGFARSVLESTMATHTPAPSIVPTHGGGLQLEWHEGGADIELMIYRPFEAELSAAFADGRPTIEELALSTDFGPLAQALRGI
jgi:hypothetical protein